MKKGHYFCDKCDDIAFGPTCQVCSAETRFITTAPVILQSGSGEFAMARPPRSPRVPPDNTAAEYFKRIRAVVAATPEYK